MGPIVQKFIAQEIDNALFRHHLPYNGPVRDDLEARAEVSGGNEASVRVLDESNRALTLDDRIDQLKDDPNFCACFPPEPPRVSRNDETKLRENFSKIVSGQVVVE